MRQPGIFVLLLLMILGIAENAAAQDKRLRQIWIFSYDALLRHRGKNSHQFVYMYKDRRKRMHFGRLNRNALALATTPAGSPSVHGSGISVDSHRGVSLDRKHAQLM
jgi:hypothetical protein